MGKCDRTLAVQALVGEANHEKLAEVLQPQIEQQKAVIDLLKKNLEALVEVKITFEKFINVQLHKGSESSISALSESEDDNEEEGDDELEVMKAQLSGESGIQKSSPTSEEAICSSSASEGDDELELLRK